MINKLLVAILAFVGVACLSPTAQASTTYISGCGNSYTGGLAGDYYYVTGSISNSSGNPCIEFDSQTSGPVILDCQGYTLSNSSSSQPLVQVGSGGSVEMVDCVLDFSSSSNDGFGVWVKSGGYLQNDTSSDKNTWNHTNLECSGSSKVVINGDSFSNSAIQIDTCDYSSVENSTMTFGDGTSVGSSYCVVLSNSQYVTFEANTITTCPDYFGVVFVGQSTGAYIVSNTISGLNDTSGTDDGILICAFASTSSCSPSSPIGTAITGLTIDYNTIKTIFDACIEFVGAATSSDVSYNDCSDAGFSMIGAYYGTSLSYITFEENYLHNSGNAAPVAIFNAESSLSSYTYLNNLTFSYNTSDITDASTSVYSFIGGYAYSFNTFSSIELGNNDFGGTLTLQSATGITDSGGNYCGTVSPSGAITCN